MPMKNLNTHNGSNFSMMSVFSKKHQSKILKIIQRKEEKFFISHSQYLENVKQCYGKNYI